MKSWITGCLIAALKVIATLAPAQQSAKDWYAKGLDAELYTQKVEYFSKAIDLDENYVDAYNARAAAQSDLGMLKDAILDFTKAIRIDSTNVFAFYNRATCHFALGNYTHSITDFDQVLQLKPAHAYAMSGKGCALLLQGKPDDAIAVLNQALWLENSLQSAIKCREEALKLRGDEPTARTLSLKTPKGKTAQPPAGVDDSAAQVTPTDPYVLKIPLAPSLGTYKLVDATSLREGPTHTTRVLLRFQPGSAVEVLEKTDEFWWKVRYKGRVGYAKAALLAQEN